MTIPEWLAETIIGFLLLQLGAFVVWAIRSQSTQAVQTATLDRIVRLLEKHSLDAFRAEIDAIKDDVRSRTASLSDDVNAKHERVNQRIEDLRDDVYAALSKEPTRT